MLTYKLAIEIAEHTSRARKFTPTQRAIIKEKVANLVDQNNVPYIISNRCIEDLYNPEEFCEEAGIPFRLAFNHLDIIVAGMHLAFLERYDKLKAEI